MFFSETLTHGVRIKVRAKFCPEHSEPEKKFWFYQYTVTIINESDDTVQLIGRHWHISDSNGQTEEVVGKGVIGKQPVLEPGKSFTYSSNCPLSTELGSMYGCFQMVTKDGEEFDANIAPFTLSQPHLIN